MTNVLVLPVLAGGFDPTPNTADWVADIAFVDKATGTPIDLTGVAFEMQVRRLPSDGHVIVAASTASGRLINGGATGVLSIRVPTSAMSGVPAGDYVTDLVATGDGIRRSLSYAPLTVSVWQGATAPTA